VVVHYFEDKYKLFKESALEPKMPRNKMFIGSFDYITFGQAHH
jgi:hypothetical protein